MCGSFNMVVDEEKDDKDLDVDSIVTNPKFLNMIKSKSVDLGDGKRAFCIDMDIYRDLFMDVCDIDVSADSKVEMSCNPLGLISDKLGALKDDIVEKEEGKKYCLIYEDGDLDKLDNSLDMNDFL